MQSPRLVPEPTAETKHGERVTRNEGAASAVGQGGQLGGDPGVEAAGAGGGARGSGALLLGQVRLGAGGGIGAQGGGFAVEALGLGIGLDVLVGEVGGDGAHRGGVDVD